MSFSRSKLSGSVSFILLFTMVMVFQTDSACGATPADGREYDIPISELEKVRKISPVKNISGVKKRKKIPDVKGEDVIPEADLTSKASVQAKTPSAKESRTILAEPDIRRTKQENSGEGRIYHSPYSFAVPDRPTVIHAVFDSEFDVVEATCRVRTVEDENEQVVKMTKVNDARYTYSATLPGLSTNSTALRYSIVFLNSQGKEIRSREYVTPIRHSTLLPAWQLRKKSEVSPPDPEKGK